MPYPTPRWGHAPGGGGPTGAYERIADERIADGQFLRGAGAPRPTVVGPAARDVGRRPRRGAVEDLKRDVVGESPMWILRAVTTRHRRVRIGTQPTGYAGHHLRAAHRSHRGARTPGPLISHRGSRWTPPERADAAYESGVMFCFGVSEVFPTVIRPSGIDP